MKRNYPLFFIDRSKPDSYPNDYVVCMDKEFGFVAKVNHLKDDNLFALFIENVNPNDVFFEQMKFNKGGVVLIIEDFLHEIKNQNTSRVKTLLKKGFKKYLHDETQRTAFGDYSIDNQIKQQQLTVEHNMANYDTLVKRSSKEYADFNIALSKEILKSLIYLKQNNRLA